MKIYAELYRIKDIEVKIKSLMITNWEEESISRTALDIAEEEGSWMRKEKSIMNAYKGDTD